MNLSIQNLMCNTTNFGSLRKKEQIKYIVVHYDANKGATARNNAVYFKNNRNLNASAHFFVDESEIYRSVPELYEAWHCGSSKGYKHKYCRNSNSIGVELCSEYSNGAYYFNAETIQNSQKLISELMLEYHIPLSNVIRHYDVTGKLCPQPLISEILWEQYKGGINSMSDLTYNEAMEKLVKAGVIQTRAYWDNAVKCVKYLDNLIINMAKRL